MKISIKVIHWLPRIICILAIAFISLFAADAFEPGKSAWKQLGDFMIHLIPSFILTAVLLVAWKWEMVGGILFVIIGIVLTPVIFLHNYNLNHLTIWQCISTVGVLTFPFIAVGVLFMVSYYYKKERVQNSRYVKERVAGLGSKFS